jgi:hypothetical protein
MTPDLRDKDIAVLQAIHNGAEDTSEIREATTLTNREINYSINEKSLEQLGLINVERPNGREQRNINGRETTTWKAKRITITDKGIQHLANNTPEKTGYENHSKRELIQRIEELETRLERLETEYKNFRTKVMERI